MAGASDNGGWPPDGGSPDELPDLPEEWGVIVIPDDLSELSDEVEAVRAELHLAPPPNRWQRFARRPGVRLLSRAATLLLRAPVLIVSMAILVTVASLFASAWPGTPRQPATQRTSGTSAAPGKTLPALDLIGPDGQAVPLLGQKPMVVIITDGCDCDRLIADTVAAVRPHVSVLAVSTTAPTRRGNPTTAAPPRGDAAPIPQGSAPGARTPQGGAPGAQTEQGSASGGQNPQGGLTTAQTPRSDGKTVLYLQDPTGHLRERAGLTTQDGSAATFVVNSTGEVLRLYQHVVSVTAFQSDLDRL
ncbi:hypothetical protein ACTOB_008376 [Actinoplanes oblitus]|uniref:Uncharacterized protein n=1 Tax=Actinoplanes oblitus TaxID=3040509 RepID=A0ABY8WH43_9ACTN|nr:hypothetical protein [Actinoplanes oblitus]WIM96207.1 hypothetical protein ACTOB_008376 [Actinoplanes oblitus]